MYKRILHACLVGLLSLIYSHSYADVNPLYKAAQEEQNDLTAAELYWQYFTDVKGDSSFPDAAADFSRLLARNNMLEDLVKFGDLLSELKPPPATPMNTIAWALAAADTALDKAYNYSVAAVAAQKLATKQPAPKDRSAKAWKERNEYRLAYYLDTQGYTLLQMEAPKKALDIFLQANDLTIDPDYELFLHIAQAYWQLDKADKSLDWVCKARYYSGETDNEKINDLIQKAYRKAKGKDADFNGYVEDRLKQMKAEEYARYMRDKLDYSAPAFSLKSLNGKVVNLNDYRGKIVLVDFWATWCGPCKRELPLLQAELDSWKDQGVVMLAISTDRDQEKVQPFITENSYTFKVLFNENTSRDYDVAGIPTLFIIDDTGTVRYRHVGYRPDIVDILKLQIAKLKK